MRKGGHRTCDHHDPRNWFDVLAGGGLVRTTCRVCKGFVGYRPAERRKSPRSKVQSPKSGGK